MLKIIEWISYDKLKEKKSFCSENFFAPNEETIFQFNKYCNELELNEYIEDVLIKELIENDYIICGDTHQYYAIPIFEDGYLELSMRKWGEIMSKAYNLKHEENTNYKNFYLVSMCPKEERLPKGCEIEI